MRNGEKILQQEMRDHMSDDYKLDWVDIPLVDDECEHDFIICKKDNMLPAVYIPGESSVNVQAKCVKCKVTKEIKFIS